MHLLQLHNYPSVSLVEFVEDELPQYAILSHTWGADSDEVTYRDIIECTGSGKAGYDKIRFCALQAKKDGLSYCWIDTCCINKTNSAELSESINCMFRWYQNAEKCYALLADVSASPSQDNIDSQLQSSRWFARGWTLQELIAPRSVEFFSKKRQRLGDRKSLEKQVHQITGISTHALRRESLSHFTIDERMSWAANRITKRPEDKIYSLLGIFDVHMEAIYGEGEHHASRRLLRELERYSENHRLSELFRDKLRLSSPASSRAVSAGQPVVFPAKKPKVSGNPTWLVPFERNSRFTSRESELTRLEEMLFGEQRKAKLAITGLGGVGKTQLVIEILYRVADKQKDCSVIWFSAVTMESLHQSYRDAARQLGIPGYEDDEADVKKLVQEHLSNPSTGQWLLVFDNADDIDMWIPKAGATPQPGQGSQRLTDYLPKSKQGVTVFTTRDRKIAVKLAQPNVVDVGQMGEEAAALLLGKCLVDPELADNREETDALLLQLTYLPLAIVQAAAYINENAISLTGYLSLLDEQEQEVVDLLSEEFEDDGRYPDIRNPVATTWLISFDQIKRRDHLAADYLSFMACIEPKSIPLSLLPPGESRKKEVDALGTLTAYSFVQKRPADECLDLHRLVHLATRNWLRKEGLLYESTCRAIMRLDEVFPDHDHENRIVWRKYLTHASYVLGDGIIRDDNDEPRIRLLWKLGMSLYREGRFNRTQRALKQVLEIQMRVLGSEDPGTISTMINLGSAYRQQCLWDKAQELEVQVMETCKGLFGLEHVDTLASMTNLAATLWEKGRRDEAEELQVQVYKICERAFGLEHPHTLLTMTNLALTYREKSWLDEAEKLGVQAVEIRKKLLGLEHPDTLRSMTGLALTAYKKREWDRAIYLQTHVVETYKTVLGPQHPDTVTTTDDLSMMLRAKENET